MIYQRTKSVGEVWHSEEFDGETGEILELVRGIGKGEVESVSDELQLTAHKLDHIREPILMQDEREIRRHIDMLKSGSGEGWAIGEVIERILDIGECERK